MSIQAGSVQTGDTVKVHFTGKLTDGTVFDSSRERDPITFEVGAGKTIKGLEDAVVGMHVGETKEAGIQPKNAYGQFRNDLVHTIDRSNFPADAELAVGKQFKASGFGRDNLVVTIVDVTGTNITIDANHPLAGKDLIFEIQLVEIV